MTYQSVYPDPACFGDWDATGCVRRVDTAKHYPEAKVGECHADGEIWSATLWDMFNYFGKTATDKLVLQSHFNVPNNPTFQDGALAILKADAQLNNNNPVNHKPICNIIVKRGILDSTINPECSWEPWGATIYANHYWAWISDPDQIPNLAPTPDNPTDPVNWTLSLDTNQITTRGVALIPNLTSISMNLFNSQPIDIPQGVSKLVVKLKSHGFYNSYPDECKEWGLISFLNQNVNPYKQFTVLVTNSNCIYGNFPAADYRIINNNQWTTYEFPLTSLNGQPTQFFFELHDKRYETNAAGGFPYYDAYYAMDIDFIDFK